MATLPSGTFGDFPIGTIIPFAGTLNQQQLQAQGWLYCNGNTVSRTQYEKLFSVIGTGFGGGDGISTYGLPDLRGRFFRGANNNAHVDPDAGSRTPSEPGGNSGAIVGSAEGGGDGSAKD
jgi:microcystin-dependent protein